MNIYALKGHKVKVKTLSAGYFCEQEDIKTYLELNKEYTIERTDINGWHTDVYLVEVPNIPFNSAFFEDVIKQSIKDDIKHKDYYRYH